MTMAELWWHAATESLTIDDLPADIDGVRLELIDGSLSVTPLGDLDHQRLVNSITRRLESGLPAGLEALPGANVVLGDHTTLIPDVVVVDSSYAVRNGLGVSPAGVRLVVEITSPSTRRRDLTIKRELYREWGAPYVIVDRSTDPHTYRTEGDLPDWARAVLG
jgi:Uma2 family endonuclease